MFADQQLSLSIHNMKRQMMDRKWTIQQESLSLPDVVETNPHFDILYESSFLVSKSKAPRQLPVSFMDLNVLTNKAYKFKSSYEKKRNAETKKRLLEEKQNPNSTPNPPNITQPKPSSFYKIKMDELNEVVVLSRPRMILEEDEQESSEKKKKQKNKQNKKKSSSDLCLADEVLVLFLVTKEAKALGKEPISRILLYLHLLSCKHTILIIHNPHDSKLLVSAPVGQLIQTNIHSASRFHMDVECYTLIGKVYSLMDHIHQPLLVEKLTEEEKARFLSVPAHNQIQQLPVLSVLDPVTIYFRFQIGDVIHIKNYKKESSWFQVNYPK